MSSPVGAYDHAVLWRVNAIGGMAYGSYFGAEDHARRRFRVHLCVGETPERVCREPLGDPDRSSTPWTLDGSKASYRGSRAGIVGLKLATRIARKAREPAVGVVMTGALAASAAPSEPR